MTQDNFGDVEVTIKVWDPKHRKWGKKRLPWPEAEKEIERLCKHQIKHKIVLC